MAQLTPLAARPSSRAVAVRGNAALVSARQRVALLGALVGGGALAVSLLTANPGLTAATVVAQGLLALLLWRPGDAPILWMVATLQWLQASLGVWHADFLGVELWTRTTARSPEEAVLMTLGWTLAWAAGMRLAIGPPDVVSASDHPVMPMRVALAIYLLHGAAAAVLGLLPGAGSLVVSFNSLRWGCLYLVFVVGLGTPHGRTLVGLVFAFELVLGWLGFFSVFRLSLLVMFLAVMSRGVLMTPRNILGIAALGALSVTLLVMWSSIKQDYRRALSGNTDAQAVRLDVNERAEVLQDLTSQVDEGALESGQDALLERVAYTNYFAHVLDWVPRVRRHTDGRLWEGALQHVIAPRLLFPDKAHLQSTTDFTEQYTGLRLTATRTTGTSISMGIPAENYIEFGQLGMFIAATVLGLLYGSVYRFFRRRVAGVLGSAFVVALLIPTTSLESGIVKTFGGFVTQCLMLSLVLLVSQPALKRLAKR